jgi:hypothetical protein
MTVRRATSEPVRCKQAFESMRCRHSCHHPHAHCFARCLAHARSCNRSPVFLSHDQSLEETGDSCTSDSTCAQSQSAQAKRTGKAHRQSSHAPSSGHSRQERRSRSSRRHHMPCTTASRYRRPMRSVRYMGCLSGPRDKRRHVMPRFCCHTTIL